MVANLQARLTHLLAAVWHHISLLMPFTGSIGPIVQLHGLTGSRKAIYESRLSYAYQCIWCAWTVLDNVKL